MHIEQITEWISQYGYFALFFFLWLGIVGMPIPDEVIVMTGGLVSSLEILQTVPSFILTYLGVISGLTLGYIVGRVWGHTLYAYLAKKRKWAIYLKHSETLLTRYGGFALCISYFLPFIRHLLPYLVGSYRMSFYRYAIYSYSAGLFWTAIYFTIGYHVHGAIHKVADLSQAWGWIALSLLVLSLSILVWYRGKFTQRKKTASSTETALPKRATD